MRLLDFFDGAQSETTPTIGNLLASGIITYPDDATYEASELGAPIEGNVYFNTTTKLIRYYNGTDWITLVDDESVQLVLNKTIEQSTIDADDNIITNLEDENIKAGAAIDVTKLHDGSVDNTEFGYLDGATSNIQSQLDGKQNTSEKDQPNGYAGLDGSGKISAAAVPAGFLQYQGTWNASTNAPTLADGVGEQGDVYRCNVAGSQDLGSGLISFSVGDWITYNGSIWERSDFVGAGMLSDLSDVDTAGLQDGDALIYNQGAGEWQPGQVQNVIQENIALVGKGSATWDASPGGSVNAAESTTETNDFAITTNLKTGYTFTPSVTGELQYIVGKFVDRTLGNGDGNIQAFLYATSSGTPISPTLDSSTTFATSNLTAASGSVITNNFIFSGNIELTAGTEYSIMFESSDTGTLATRRGNINETFSTNYTETGADTETFSASAVQETMYFQVFMDNVSGSLVLSNDSYVSVPPLPDSYHTIQAQTIYILDGQCAYITLDRAAGSTTNRTVTVDDIVNVTPDNDILIIARVAGTDCYFGLHDPQRISDADTVNIQQSDVAVDLTPVATTISSFATTAPTGYLYCDGSAVSRATYADLYSAMGNACGEGDGSTTFNLPDLRGRFLRGQDDSSGLDPDAASRTAMNTGGNTGDNVGTVEGHAFQTHNHSFNVTPTGTNANTASSSSAAIATRSSSSASLFHSTGGATNFNFVNSAAASGAQSQPSSETRPVNAAVRYYIKY